LYRINNVLFPLLLNFAFQYAIRKVQAKQEGLKLYRTHQLLVCADNGSVVGEIMHTIKKAEKLYYLLVRRLV
jgi:hypothetical protein